MVSIAGLLKPLREKGVDALEELAARFAAGETVAAGEVQAVLDRTRRGEADLQKAIERHERVNRLRAEAAAGAAFRRKLDAAEAELSAAHAEMLKAQARYNAMLAKHGEAMIDLRVRAEAAERAGRELMSPDNLPPSTAARLQTVRRAADEAEQAVTVAQLALSRARKSLAEGEEALAQAKAATKDHPAMDSLKEKTDRLRVTVDTRRKLVAEGEDALRVAESFAAAARRERDAFQSSTAQAVGAA